MSSEHDEHLLDAAELDDCCVPQEMTALPKIMPPKFVTTNMEAHFSPHGGCLGIIVKEINSAKKSINVQAYGFTSRPIYEALVGAIKRGVNVQLIADKKASAMSSALVYELAAAGAACFIDGKHAIAHNKVMIIDRSVVITGSFNFTKNAETSNSENIILVRNSALATVYLKNWEIHLNHSDKAVEKPQLPA